MATKKTPSKTTATQKSTKSTKTTPANAAATKRTQAAKPATQKAQPATADSDDKKLSAIDAAAQVLAESKEPMNAKQMIDAMAEKGLWTTPGGKTPHATLYSAILREIKRKGKDARFRKIESG